jgi:heat-inducible transcriptional repressor
MSSHEDDVLNQRKAQVLEVIVTEYITTGQPVSSQHVTHQGAIGASSATVRAEMASLEHDGFLIQPHTSAGRIPTDKAYRYFVDHLTAPGVLGDVETKTVSDFFDHVYGEVEDLLERTSGLLSSLTSYAAVVVGPGHSEVPVRSLQLVSLSSRVVLLVVVFSDGGIEKRTLEFGRDVTEEELDASNHELSDLGEYKTLSAIVETGQRNSSHAEGVQAVLASCFSAFREFQSRQIQENVFVGGPSKVAASFDTAETIRDVLSTLEEQLVLVTLLRDVMGRGMSVAIGEEHGYRPLASCAVVVAPVTIDGQASGTIGLLGPTRMNYPQALAAAHVVSEGLGDHFAHSLSYGAPHELLEGEPKGSRHA